VVVPWLTGSFVVTVQILEKNIFRPNGKRNMEFKKNKHGKTSVEIN